MKHPLHPALVHFPIACWSLASAADGIGLFWSIAQLPLFAALLLLVGCASGLVAAGAGFQQLLKLPAEHPALSDVNLHMGMALSSWCLYAGSLFLRVENEALVAPGMLALLLSGLGLIVLLATGWLGGKLVYVHGVGTASDQA